MNAPVRLEPMRWWHIEELLPIEADLFGVERWSAAMFWNELANGNFYLVARDDGAGCDTGRWECRWGCARWDDTGPGKLAGHAR